MEIIIHFSIPKCQIFSHTPASSMATFKMKPVAAADTAAGGENFFDRNKRLARPTSPHLTIYKMQLTAVLSITHRATGCAQSALLAGELPWVYSEALLYGPRLHGFVHRKSTI